MSDSTARFALPFILPGQAQKEHYHNEALARIDAVLHPAVEGEALAIPPPAPASGQCWIVGQSASGDWANKDDQLAGWTDGGWRFTPPQPGMLVWNKQAAHFAHFDGAEWRQGVLPAASLRIGGQQVVGPRHSPVPSPSGGTIIDAEARGTIGQIIAALMSHGLIG